MEGVIAVIAPWLDGQYCCHMLREGGMPFGSSAPETVEESKRRCQQTMGILPEDWQACEGEPFWLPILRSAFSETLSKFPDENEQATDC